MFPPSTPPPKSGGSTTHARSLSPRASSPLHRRKSVLVPPNLNDRYLRCVAVHTRHDCDRRGPRRLRRYNEVPS